MPRMSSFSLAKTVKKSHTSAKGAVTWPQHYSLPRLARERPVDQNRAWIWESYLVGVRSRTDRDLVTSLATGCQSTWRRDWQQEYGCAKWEARIVSCANQSTTWTQSGKMHRTGWTNQRVTRATDSVNVSHICERSSKCSINGVLYWSSSVVFTWISDNGRFGSRKTPKRWQYVNLSLKHTDLR